MTNVEHIEHQVRELSAEELAAFREWFIEFDEQAWDRQFEADAAAGKLDQLVDRALREHSAGRTTKL